MGYKLMASGGGDLSQVQAALGRCLSVEEIQRKEAHDYLAECENHPAFALTLLDCFLAHSQSTSNVKLQSLIYLKNMISRRWGTTTNRHLFKSSARTGTRSHGSHVSGRTRRNQREGQGGGPTSPPRKL
jgi:hypothetical protein